jgi:hypothetical protein
MLTVKVLSAGPLPTGAGAIDFLMTTIGANHPLHANHMQIFNVGDITLILKGHEGSDNFTLKHPPSNYTFANPPHASLGS